MLAANGPHPQVCHRGIFQLQKSPKSVMQMVLGEGQEGKLRGVRILSCPKPEQRESKARSCHALCLWMTMRQNKLAGAQSGGEAAEVV